MPERGISRRCGSSIGDNSEEANAKCYQMQPNASCLSSIWIPCPWLDFAALEDEQNRHGLLCRTPDPKHLAWHSWQQCPIDVGRTKSGAQGCCTPSRVGWQLLRVDRSSCSPRQSWSKSIWSANLGREYRAWFWWVSLSWRPNVVQRMEPGPYGGCRAPLQRRFEYADQVKKLPYASWRL